MIRVLTVLGTRPEAIKVAPVLREFRRRPSKFSSVVCVTAQHREMLDQTLVALGIEPDHDVNAPPSQFARGAFHMEPMLRTWIAFAGFKSRAITWLGYESWFGRVVLHWILYAFAGPGAARSAGHRIRISE